ncbi:MAG: S49 family peptidase [Gammaproteobacteria bacterium]|nr:S49 family peptidase [Gammaproteobacteria bacterium]
MTEHNDNWEKEILSKIATEGLKEQQRSRRWGIFFKLLTFLYLFFILIIFSSSDGPQPMGKAGEKHTALVELKGIIAPGTEASADKIVTALRDAFKHENTAGVILRINSPGGSPVQSGYIYDEILRLRNKYPEKPLYAVITDIGASGGYYVAAAAEKIYADQASLVGSIGVRMDNFGVVEAMKKLGIERRTLTAGKNKALLDPFSPADPSVNKHLQTLLDNIHGQFINAVKQGRSDRLKETEGMFSGLIWTGDQSVEIGLVDELASSSQVARDVIGAESIVDFSVKPDFFERFSRSIGTEIGHVLVEKNLLPQLK